MVAYSCVRVRVWYDAKIFDDPKDSTNFDCLLRNNQKRSLSSHSTFISPPIAAERKKSSTKHTLCPLFHRLRKRQLRTLFSDAFFRCMLFMSSTKWHTRVPTKNFRPYAILKPSMHPAGEKLDASRQDRVESQSS